MGVLVVSFIVKQAIGKIIIRGKKSHKFHWWWNFGGEQIIRLRNNDQRLAGIQNNNHTFKSLFKNV